MSCTTHAQTIVSGMLGLSALLIEFFRHLIMQLGLKPRAEKTDHMRGFFWFIVLICTDMASHEGEFSLVDNLSPASPSLFPFVIVHHMFLPSFLIEQCACGP
jgi:hypothetical protein